MARRSTLTDDDLNVIETSLDNSIKSAQSGPRPSDDEKFDINVLAPLFRVREKILTMKGGAVKAVKQPRARATKPQAVTAD
jgi:hypothetical protein